MLSKRFWLLRREEVRGKEQTGSARKRAWLERQSKEVTGPEWWQWLASGDIPFLCREGLA
ncbi:MAG TPA: hypothetical protein GXZ69_08170 [Spirochaetales bacterium]|nr:hypothetical protein [Spirochaetales bacterium]